jgi:hypothetical protein
LKKKTLFGWNGTGTFQPEFWQNLWNGLKDSEQDEIYSSLFHFLN